MKRYKVIPIFLVLTALIGCTKLSDQDRATLDETRMMVESSHRTAAQAEMDARAARQQAENAISLAQAASEKSDRMFQQGQEK
jgi:hypothetical protein